MLRIVSSLRLAREPQTWGSFQVAWSLPSADSRQPSETGNSTDVVCARQLPAAASSTMFRRISVTFSMSAIAMCSSVEWAPLPP